MTDPIVLVVTESPRRDGRYTATCNGQTVVESSREPFLAGARVLLARGFDPAARYVMRRTADGPDALISTLGKAAKLTVADSDGQARFVGWTPPPSQRGT
jgi:hypothetical protein